MELKAKNLIVILGPTGVGKSSTAIKLAHAFKGEIINCDSMQVYQGFDIGTDKISTEKTGGIPHHLIDIVKPSVQFTAADFVEMALETSESIFERECLPIITGGTGLYLKALFDGLFPEGKIDPNIREGLVREAREVGLEKLFQELKSVDPEYAKKIGENDRIRIIRALEVYHVTHKPLSEHFKNTRSFVEGFHIVKVGLMLERQELYTKIEDRVERMFERGMVEEVQRLLDEGVAEQSPPFRALGYTQVLRYLKQELTLEETKSITKKETRHYAKRQITWFNKMEGIRWFSPEDFTAIKKFIRRNLR